MEYFLVKYRSVMGQKQATCLDWCLSVNVNCMTQMILQALGQFQQLGTSFIATLFGFAGHSACVAGLVAWFPRISLWLPLWVLWCDPTQLYSAKESDPECLPTEHEASRPFHPQSKGRIYFHEVSNGKLLCSKFFLSSYFGTGCEHFF